MSIVYIYIIFYFKECYQVPSEYEDMELSQDDATKEESETKEEDDLKEGAIICWCLWFVLFVKEGNHKSKGTGKLIGSYFWFYLE